MTAIVVMKQGNQFQRVADCSTEYHALCAAGWDIDDIIGETEEDEREREASEARCAVIDRLNAQCDAIEAAAKAMGYDVTVKWANESTSRYIMCDNYKIRVADHGACYACDISVDPYGLDVNEAIKWLQERKDEAN